MSIVANAYIFRYGFLWLGWYLVKRKETPPFYYDNTKYLTLYSESNIPYLTIGFTERGVLNRIHRYAIKHFSDKEEID